MNSDLHVDLSDIEGPAVSCPVARKAIYLKFLWALLVCVSAAAAPTVPNTRAGEALVAWLAAFNAGDIERARAFKQSYESEIEVEKLLSQRWAIGGYDLLSIERSEQTSLVALIKERESDRAVRLRLSLDVTAAKPVLKLDGDFADLPPLPSSHPSYPGIGQPGPA